MNDRYTCIAIDDEPLALLVIEQFCQRFGHLDLRTFDEPRHGFEAIIAQRPELVFLDIEMNSIDGLEIARHLPKACSLIFTTAHAQYALDGFDLDAVDFLHKPFSYDRFERAVTKAIRHIEAQRAKTPAPIVVKQAYSNVSIAASEILYIKAMENYTQIFRTTGGSLLSRTSMKNIEKMLPQGAFLRVHRSYIIPLDRVVQFSKREIRLSGCEQVIPVGRQDADAIFGILTTRDPS